MRIRIAIVSLACILAPGCGTAPVRPVVSPVDVQLSLGLSASDGSAAMPITVTVVARNLGRETVYHGFGCGCDGIGFELLGPDGEPIATASPCASLPMCPCGLAPLDPGTTLEGSFRFEGDVYRRPGVNDPGGPCVRERAISGDYTVIVRYAFVWNRQQGTREQRATFHWSGP